MLGDLPWVKGEVRRLTEASARMLAAHHRAEGQLTVYHMIEAAMEAEGQDARSQRIPSPDDPKPSVHSGDEQAGDDQ